MSSFGLPRILRTPRATCSVETDQLSLSVIIRRRIAVALFCTLASFLSIPVAVGADRGETAVLPPDSTADFAGVFDENYHQAPEDLSLDPAGVDRATALAHYFEALHHQARGDSAAAIGAYEKTLALAPANPRIARRAAELIAAAGAGFKGGKNLLETALASSPKDPSAKLHLSAFLAKHGGPAEKKRAVVLAKETVREFPENAEALEHYVGISMATGQSSGAARLINSLANENKKRPARFWLAMARASILIWPQKKGEAFPSIPGAKINRTRIDGFFAHALKSGSDNPTIAREAANFFEFTGRFNNAAKVYETLLENRKDLLAERSHLARLYRKLGRNEDAAAELEELAKIDPRQPEIRDRLADLYEATGDHEKAILHAEQALKLKGGSLSQYLRIGRLLEAAGQKENWLSHARQTFDMFPKSPHAGFMLGHALHDASSFAEAADILEKSVILCQAYDRRRLDSEFYLIYGKALAEAGDLEKAERTFVKGLEGIPQGSPVSETVPLLTALAETQHRAGKQNDAIKNLRRVHSASPDDTEITRILNDWESQLPGNPKIP